MRTWKDRRAEAARHVTSGNRIIERQRALIARRKALGENTEQSESLLTAFERSQAIFEADLRRIDSEPR
jgi:hypothetical protein